MDNKTAKVVNLLQNLVSSKYEISRRGIFPGPCICDPSHEKGPYWNS